MSCIYLIRHGLTEYNLQSRFQGQLDIPLNEEGLKQAQALSQVFKDKKIDALYTSDLKRAVQTIYPIARLCKMQFQVKKELREVDVGKLEGLSWQEARKDYPSWVKHGRNKGYPGGETRIEIEKRVACFWQNLLKTHSGDDVVVVSHGGIIKTLVCQLLKIDSGNRSSFIIDNCSISTIVISESGPKIKALNNTYHLEGTI